MRAIAAGLTADRIPTPTGRTIEDPATGEAIPAWLHCSVRWILTHPAYMGQAAAWRYVLTHDRQRNTTSSRPRPAEEHIPLPPGTVPALVDEATFAAVQERLAINKARASRNNKNPEGALLRAGFLRCAYCGRVMGAISLKDGTISYRCGGKPHLGQYCRHQMRAHVLDSQVWADIEAFLAHPEIVAEQVALARTDDPTKADLALVDRALADVERRQRNTAQLAGAVDDPDAAAPLVAQLRGLAEQRRELEAEREGILARRATWEQAQAQLDSLAAWCNLVAAELRTLTYEEKRTALTGLGATVRLWNAERTPRYEITVRPPLNLAIVDRSTTPSIACPARRRSTPGASRRRPASSTPSRPAVTSPI